MKKKILTALMLMGSIGIVHAQSSMKKVVSFGYDSSGNIVSREITVEAQDIESNENSSEPVTLSNTFGNYTVTLGPSPTSGTISGKVSNYDGSQLIIVAVSTSNGQAIRKTFSDGNFSMDISSLPKGVVSMNIIVVGSTGSSAEQCNVKIILN